MIRVCIIAFWMILNSYVVGVDTSGYSDLVILRPYIEGVSGSDKEVEVEFFVSQNFQETPLVVSGDSKTVNLSNQSFSMGHAVLKLAGLDASKLATDNVWVKIKVPVEQLEKSIPFYSIAYSLRAYRAIEVEQPEASRIKTPFLKVVTLNRGIEFLKDKKTGVAHLSHRAPYVNISNGLNGFDSAVNIQGTVNAKQLYINGQEFIETLDWKSKVLGKNGNISTTKKVGIGFDQREPDVDLEVQGVINATDFLLKGSSVLVTDEWKEDNGNVYSKVHKNVGIGLKIPKAALDVGGAVIIASANERVAGTLFFQETPFSSVASSSFVAVVENNKIQNLDRLSSDSENGRGALFESFFKITSKKDFGVGFDDDFMIHALTNKDMFRLNLSSLRNLNEESFSFFDETHQKIASINFYDARQRVLVNASVDAEMYTIDGLPINESMRNGEFFLRKKQSESRFDLFYNHGNVSIGQFDPSANLEIASPFRPVDSLVPTKDPAISFSVFKGDEVQRFTMGLDVDSQNQFLIQSGSVLGNKEPLLAVQRNKVGIGLSDPKANLQVSGNKGFLLNGTFDFFNSSADVSVIEELTKPGNRMIFSPYNASLRIGRFLGDENLLKNVGIDSASFGLANQVPGNFSSSYSGKSNSVVGAYSTAISAHNQDIQGLFSVGIGAGTRVGPEDHGSFVMSHSGIFGGGTVDVSALTKRVQPLQEMQFIINTPESSKDDFIGSFVGINTNQTSSPVASLMVVESPGVSWTQLKDHFSLSGAKSQELLKDLRDKAVVDNSTGKILVPDKRYFKSVYQAPGFPVVVTLNSVTFFEGYLKRLKKNGALSSKVELSQHVASLGLFDAYIVGGAKHDKFYGIYKQKKLRENAFELRKAIISNHGFIKDVFNSFGFFSPEFIKDSCDVTQYINNDGSTYIDSFSSLERSRVFTFIKGLSDEENGGKCKNGTISPVKLDAVIALIKEHDTRYNAPEERDYTSASYYTYFANTVSKNIEDDIYAQINAFSDVNLDVFDSNKLYLLSELDSPLGDVTSKNLQAFLADRYNLGLLTLKGRFVDAPIHVTRTGMFGVGYTEMGFPGLVVSDNMSVFPTNLAYKSAFSDSLPIRPKFSVDNLSPTLNRNDPTYMDTFVIRSVTSSVVMTTNFVIDAKGHVGLGMRPAGQYRFEVDGIVLVDGTMKNTDTGQTFSGKINPIVFQSDTITPNIAYVSANVGLGTRLPSAMLHLTNFDTSANLRFADNVPNIRFNVDDASIVDVGITTNSGAEVSLRMSGMNHFKMTPNLFFPVTPNKLPGFSMTKPGGISSMRIAGQLLVATKNTLSDKHALVVDDLNVDSIFVWTPSENALASFRATGTPWDLNVNGEPYLLSKPGIGINTATPQAELEIGGTISANKFIVQNEFKVPLLQLKLLKLRENTNTLYDLFLENKHLFFQIGTKKFNITDTLTSGAGVSGNVTNLNPLSFDISPTGMFFSYPPEKNNQDLYWKYNNDKNIFELNSEFDLTPTQGSRIVIGGNKEKGSFSWSRSTKNITSTLGFLNNLKVGAKIDTVITYDGAGRFWTDSYSYAQLPYRLKIVDAPQDQNITLNVRGIDVHLDTPVTAIGSSAIQLGTKLYGVFSDVRAVNIQEGGETTKGYKASAVFMGDVGIGTTQVSRNKELVEFGDLSVSPNILVVSGNIKADSFVISDRMVTPRLQVGTNVLAQNGKFGVGTLKPEHELDVQGTGRFKALKAQKINAKSLRNPTASFRVDSGFVGFGVAANFTPGIENVVFKRSFDSNAIGDVVYKKHLLKHSQDFEKDITLKRIDVKTITLNDGASTFGGTLEDPAEMRAVNIDLKNLKIAELKAAESVTVNGVFVDVGAVKPSNKMQAAVFKNGPVIIGLDKGLAAMAQPDLYVPEYELEIFGDIEANDIKVDNKDFKTTRSRITYTNLVVTGNTLVTGKVTMNSLFVNSISYNDIQLGAFDLQEKSIKISKDLEVLNQFVVTGNTFFNVLGNANSVKGALTFVTGNVKDAYLNLGSLVFNTASMNLSQTLTVLGSITINEQLAVGSDRFNFSSQKPSGVNTYKPFFEFPSSGTFSMADTKTWNAVSMLSGTDNEKVSIGIELMPGVASGWGLLMQPARLLPGEEEKRPASVALDLVVAHSGKKTFLISSTGNIALGGELSDSPVDVYGDFSSIGLQVTGNLFVDTLAGFPGDAIQVHSTLNVAATLNSLAQIEVSNPVLFVSHNNLVSHNNAISLYFDRTNKALYFNVATENVSANISNVLAGGYKQSHAFVFSSQNYLVSMPLKFLTQNITVSVTGNVFQVDSSPTVSFELRSLVSKSNTSTIFKELNMTVKKRAAISDGIYGKQIRLVSTNYQKDADKFKGLDVDLTALVSTSNIFLGDATEKYSSSKYAAIFKGGNIVLSSQNVTSVPSADVHVQYAFLSKPAFLVQDSNSPRVAFVVSGNANITGNVGLGSSVGANVPAKLFISSNVTSLPVLKVDDALGVSLFNLSSAGDVGVGIIATENYNLDVLGTALFGLGTGRGDITVNGTLKFTTLADGVVVNYDANDFFKADIPNAQTFKVTKNLVVSGNLNYLADILVADSNKVFQELDIDLGASALDFSSKRILKGLNVVVTANADGNGREDDTYVGVSVDMKQLIGAYNQGALKVEPSKYTGLFQGGQFVQIASGNIGYSGLFNDVPEDVLVYVSSNITGKHLVNAAVSADLLIDSMDGTIDYLKLARLEGSHSYLGIGGISKNSLMSVVSNNTNLMKVQSLEGSDYFEMDSTGLGVMKSAAAGFSLSVQGNLDFSLQAQDNAFVLNGSRVGIGTSNIGSMFDIAVTDNVSHYVAIQNSLFVTKNAVLFIPTDSKLASISENVRVLVSSNELLAIGKNLGVGKSWYDSLAVTGGMLIQTVGADPKNYSALWMGVSLNQSAAVTRSILAYGKGKSEFVFKQGELEFLRFSKEGRLGVFSSSPQETLEVSQRNSKSGYFRVNDTMVIDNTGRVGLFTTTPAASFHVSGNVRVKKIVGDSFGGHLAVKGVVVSKSFDIKTSSLSTFTSSKFVDPLLFNKTLDIPIMYLQTVLLKKDGPGFDVTKNNVINLTVKISSSNKGNAKSMVGLMVDVKNLQATAGNKYAAVFFDKKETGGQINNLAKVVVALSPTENSKFKSQYCVKNPSQCLANPKYDYGFSVFVTQNRAGVEIAGFSGGIDSKGVSRNLVILSGGATTNHKLKAEKISSRNFHSFISGIQDVSGDASRFFSVFKNKFGSVIKNDDTLDLSELETKISQELSKYSKRVNSPEDLSADFRQQCKNFDCLDALLLLDHRVTTNVYHIGIVSKPSSEPKEYYRPLTFLTGINPVFGPTFTGSLGSHLIGRVGINIASTNSIVIESTETQTATIASFDMPTYNAGLSKNNDLVFVVGGGYVSRNILVDSENIIKNPLLSARTDMRLGKLDTLSNPDSGGGKGSQLFFSGTSLQAGASDSDNNMYLTMFRDNIADSLSALKVDLDIEEASGGKNHVEFQAGYTDVSVAGNSYYNPVFRVGFKQDINLPFVDIGLSSFPTGNFSLFKSRVKGLLQVVDQTDANNQTVAFGDASNDLEKVLSLTYNTEFISLDQQAKFINFSNRIPAAVNSAMSTNPSNVGSIQPYITDTTEKGVRFVSGGADYAEYVLKENPLDEFVPGDVVGIYNGKVARFRGQTDQIMVISSAPIVVGNYPGKDVIHLYALCSFLGQVSVRVAGNVKPGDLLIAAQDGSGRSIGVREEDLRSEDLPYIVGRAWGPTELKKVHALIGFNLRDYIITRYMARIQRDLNKETKANKLLESSYKEQLDQLDNALLKLQKTVSLRE